MRLPGFEDRPVESSAPAAQRQAGAVARQALVQFGDVISQGIAAYAEEVAKSESMKAEAELATSLDSIQQSIASREYVSAREAREALGAEGVAALPPESRKFLEGRKDDDLVPTFFVGGAMYEDGARKAIDNASQHLTVNYALREKFRADAATTVQRRKAGLNAQHAEQMHRYTVGSQVASLDAMLNAAASSNDFARVRDSIDSSAALPPDLKTKLRAQVDKAQDSRPIDDALRLDSLPMLRRQLLEVNDLTKKLSFSPDERRQSAAALERRIADLEKVPALPDPKKELQDNAGRIWKTLTGTYSRAALAKGGWTPEEALTIKKALIPQTSGPVGDDEWRKMHAWVDQNTLKPTNVGGGAAKKDMAAEQARLKLYDDLNKFAQATPGAFKDDKLPFGPNGSEVPLHTLIPNLKAEHFTKFSDLQRTLREGGTQAPKYQDFVTENQIVDGLSQKYGIDPADKDNAPKIRKLRDVVQIAIQRKAPDGNLPFEEKQKTAEAAVAAQFKAEPKWFGLYTTNTAPLLDLNIPTHVASAFAEVVGSKRITMDAAVKLAPLYAADEPTIAAALDAAGVREYDTAAAIDLYGWTQANRKTLDERLKSKGVLTGDESRDSKLRYLLAIETRKAR